MPDADYSTVETRECCWLSTYGDGLPALLADNGGPWEVLQAYWTRTPGTKKTQLYVMSQSADDNRTSNTRIRMTCQVTLVMYWPIRTTSSPLAEQEQQKFKSAIQDTITRVRGPQFDKTHGGAFLSVGEDPRMPGVHVDLEDPRTTIPADSELRGTISYYLDDFEIND